jgi:DmsE family decaheme c-type cytochrome
MAENLMVMHICRSALTVLLAGALLSIQAEVCAADSSKSLKAAAQYTTGGADSCLRCHGSEHMLIIAETAHGNPDDPHTPYAQQGCESCHGPGSLHVSRARGGTGFPALLRFGDRTTRPQQTAACLNCHAEEMGDVAGMEWTGSLHDTPRMTCGTCHRMHTTDNPLADRDYQTQRCALCHKKQIASHPDFADKGVVFDELTCYDCHDVHQLIGKDTE